MPNTKVDRVSRKNNSIQIGDKWYDMPQKYAIVEKSYLDKQKHVNKLALLNTATAIVENNLDKEKIKAIAKELYKLIGSEWDE